MSAQDSAPYPDYLQQLADLPDPALRGHAQMLAQALAMVSDLVLITDREARICLVHQAADHDLPPFAPCLGHDVQHAVIPSAIAQPLHEALVAAINTGHSTEAQCSVMTKAGQRWYQYRCQAITGPGADALGAACIMTDVTKSVQWQKDQRKVHQEYSQRFRGIFEEASLMSAQGYDERRRVIYWNQASETLYGIPRQQAMGKRIEDLIIPPAMRDQVVEGIQRWMNKGIAIPAGQLTLQRGDGTPVTVYSSHALFRNPLTGQRELYCIDIDLSDRHPAP